MDVGEMGSVVMRDRRHLAKDGIIIAAIGIIADGETCRMSSGPEIISKGFVFMREADDLIYEMKEVVQSVMFECELKNTADYQYIKNRIREDLKEHVWQKTKRNPMILPILMEV